ncbi:uncharacterized protein METZ01_LOCUS386982, partial [marine metagenome]
MEEERKYEASHITYLVQKLKGEIP